MDQPITPEKSNTKNTGKLSRLNAEKLNISQNSIQKILIPTDFSSLSDLAMTYATSILKNSKAEILFIHLFDLQPKKVNVMININDVIEDSANQSMNEIIEENRKKYPDLEINGICKEGRLVSGINETVLHREIDLVIMGIGTSTVLNNFLGSKTPKILSEMTVPLLIVPNESDYTIPKQILMICKNSKLNNSEIDSSLSLVYNAFGDQEKTILTSSEQVDFELTNHISESTTPESDIKSYALFNTKNDEGVNTYLSDNNIDMMILVGKKRRLWTRFLKSSAGKTIEGQPKIPILLWS